MILISLEMKNFRQHLDTRINFAGGVTGVIGPNGAGKTTILEAIAWALYGAAALRGNNDTVRSRASQGGEKPFVKLTFELGGSCYSVTRSLDAGGRSGTATLDIDGRAVSSGINEVNAAVARLLGMDYQAFFSSFFTGQKQLEFMSSMDGRARAAMISRMLGYDRLTRARDRATEDRRLLNREIEGLERGLPDPEELKSRRKKAEEDTNEAARGVEAAEKAHAAAASALGEIEPAKKLLDEKSRRHDELARRLEIDRASRESQSRTLARLRLELVELARKQADLDAMRPDLERYEKAAEEYRAMRKLQEYEAQRQSIMGTASALASDVKKLESRERELAAAGEQRDKMAAALAEAQRLLSEKDQSARLLREKRISDEHSLAARIDQLNSARSDIESKRFRIVEAGCDGVCPTCERALGEELSKVLANFESQTKSASTEVCELESRLAAIRKDNSEIETNQADLDRLTLEVAGLREEKSALDARMVQLSAVRADLAEKKEALDELGKQLAGLPEGFDQTRFGELHKIGEELRPVWGRAREIASALERKPGIQQELNEVTGEVEEKSRLIAEAETALAELAFSKADHDRLTATYEQLTASGSAARIELEKRRGELNAARGMLERSKQDEAALKEKREKLDSMRSERLHLQVLAETLEKLRAELNDRIRPDLEAAAGDLLATMTDGRYNTLEVNDNYEAMIRDDGELKPVISGGEDDIVNLALRLAVSRMIADRAGQSFSLLVLDEVFGSLDETRRDNVVALLANLKNRFEQIILITHVESIHDAVDNCLRIEFDERSKTSRLRDRADDDDLPFAPELALDPA